MKKRVVVIDVVGLSLEHFNNKDQLPNIASLLNSGQLLKMKPTFPAVTLTAQAALTTGKTPSEHGIIANGFYSPDNFEVAFWEQASRLVQSEKIWDRLKKNKPGLTSALLFMQNSLYADSEIIITPKPMHTDKGLVQWCYSKPVNYYEQLSEKIGEFDLKHYWGPLAAINSSHWIASAAVETIPRHKPDLMFVYLPHLDYCSQRHGPNSPIVLEELLLIDEEVGRIIKAVDDSGSRNETTFIIISEYKFYQVDGDIALNRILRRNGLLKVRNIAGLEYLDIELSPAFAMVDHQVAHLYIKPGYKTEVLKLLTNVDGIDLLLASDEDKKRYHINHDRTGDIVAVSARNRWFSYYWWEELDKAPDFAGQVDIHRKPGYDPLELFIDRKTLTIPQDTGLIHGSHGYPPVTENDFVPFLISRPAKTFQQLPNSIEMTEVSEIIEKILI